MVVIPISGKAGHGKDTLAGFMKTNLEKQGKRVLITHYGDLLKYICRPFFGWDGQKNKEGRTLLQTVGTEVVREQEPDFWVNFVYDVVTMVPNEWDYVLIPDARFPNEVDLFKSSTNVTAYHVRIIRPSFSKLTPEQQQHPSETSLDNPPYDILVINDQDLTNLRRIADDLCNVLINGYVFHY